MAHTLLLHARRVIEAHLEGRNWREEWDARDASPSRGCFVSLKIGRRLRGCIGTVFPVRPTLEEEIADNAVAAATRDPRFAPLQSPDLRHTRLSIDLLTPLEPVDSHSALDPKVYGVVVKSGKDYGVLLPDIPGVKSVAQQIEICREKAGIAPEEAVTLHRFQVARFHE